MAPKGWLHAAIKSLRITKGLPQSHGGPLETEKELIEETITLWQTAYDTDNLRQYAENFGLGLSKVLTLHDEYVALNGTFIRFARGEAMNACNQGQLRVTFDPNGPIFG
jgi:hypothetical protein